MMSATFETLVEGLNAPPELNKFQSFEYRIRNESARALAELGDPRALLPLLRLFSAAESYRKTWTDHEILLGEARDPHGLHRAPKFDGRFIDDCLAKFHHDRFLDEWHVALKDGDAYLGRAAANAIGIIKNAASLPHLQQLLRANESVRPVAITALGKIGDARAVPWLTELFREAKDDSARYQIADSLLALGDAQAKEWLADQLHHPLPAIQRQAAERLRTVRDERAREWLARQLRDGDMAEQWFAARGLVDYRDERCQEWWADKLSTAQLFDSNRQLRPEGSPWEAALQLEKLGDPRGRHWFATQLTGSLAEQAANKLIDLGDPRGLDWYATQMSGALGVKAASVLVKKGDERGQEWLVRQLAGGASACEAATALARANDKRGIDWLIAQIRKGAKEALRAGLILDDLGDPRALALLMHYVHGQAQQDGEPDHLGTVISRLTKLRAAEAVRPLIKCLNRAQSWERHSSIYDGLCEMVQQLTAAIAGADLARIRELPLMVNVTLTTTRAVYEEQGSFYNSMAEKDSPELLYHRTETTTVPFDHSKLRNLAREEIADRNNRPLPFAEPIAALPVATPIDANDDQVIVAELVDAPAEANDEEIIVAEMVETPARPAALPEAVPIATAKASTKSADAAAAAAHKSAPAPYLVRRQADQFQVVCHCGSRYNVPFEFAGKRTKCKKCGQPIVIPQ